MSSTQSRVVTPRNAYHAVFVPGDGIGPEVAWAARRVVHAAGVDVVWEDVPVGQELFLRTGRAVPESAVKAFQKIPVILKGPLDSAGAGIIQNPNLEISEALNVFASVRRCRFMEGTPAPWHGFDLMLIKREGPRSIYPCDIKSTGNLEGVDGEGAELERGASDIRIVKRADLYRFIDFGFTHASRTGRKRICVAHKKNVMKNTEKMFLDVAEEVAERYPAIEVEDQLVDHVALQLARAPGRFDVILVDDLYGDVLGDLAVGISGGLGLAPQAQYGTRGVLFGTVHGTSPKYAGLDCANPCAMILAACEMLEHMGERKASAIIENGVCRVLAQGLHTRDLAQADRTGLIGARGFTDAVIGNILAGSLWGRKGLGRGVRED